MQINLCLVKVYTKFRRLATIVSPFLRGGWESRKWTCKSHHISNSFRRMEMLRFVGVSHCDRAWIGETYVFDSLILSNLISQFVSCKIYNKRYFGMCESTSYRNIMMFTNNTTRFFNYVRWRKDDLILNNFVFTAGRIYSSHVVSFDMSLFLLYSGFFPVIYTYMICFPSGFLFAVESIFLTGTFRQISTSHL